MAKISKEEYDKVKQAVAKNYTADSVKSYTDAYNQAKTSGSSTKDAYSSASGLLQKSTASSGGTTSGGTSSGGVSGNNTSGGDVYGDVSKKATTNQAMDFSNYTGAKTLSNDNALFGKDAIAKQQTDSNFLTNRNNTIAYELQNLGTTGEDDIRKYLEKFDSYKNADQLDKDNTVNAIKTRLSEVTKNGETKTEDTVTFDNNGNKVGYTAEQIDEKNSQARQGYYRNPDGSYYEIHGYQALVEAGYGTLLDGMTEEDKKYISNLWDKGMQELAKVYLDNKRQDKQLRDRQDIQEDLYKIERERNVLQAAQTLRQARESYDNLKQNWQYLGNMGMPGTSATKIQAIGDAITEAETTLNEIQKLTKLSLDAQEKQWEGQVLQYTQQIQNLQYDLDWKVGKEIQAALGEFTTAELEGKLDTIDGITAFKKELLDKLNNNLSGITSASLNQMQYINDEYQKVADKMYEYAQNANKVNADMSSVLGYYVDGNGNPIFNAKGETIRVPKDAPLNPIYDKDSGSLIVFGYDDNGNIVANVQQIVSKRNSGGFFNGGYSFGGGASGGYLDIPRTGKNVGADTNNFGNFTSMVEGAIGMYHSPNGRDYAVFANAQDGYNALVRDLEGKKNGNTRTGLNGNSTIEELMGTWVNGSGSVDPSNYYAQAFYKATGLKPGTKIGSVDAETLAKGIMAGEGTLNAYNNGGVDLSSYANQGGNTQYPAALVRLFNKDKLTDSDYKWLEDEGISRWDFEEMRDDYLKQQGGDVAYGKGMGSSILDKIIVSEDNKASQNEDYGFASRAWRADEAIKELEKEFSWTWNWDTPEWTKSDKHKLFDSYKEAFINAWLRKESGANITDAEFIKAEKFFPKAGDSDEVIKQKQKLREGIIEGLFQSSGKASDGTELVEIYRNNRDKIIVGEESGEPEDKRKGVFDKMMETNVNGEGANTTFDETWVR